MQVYPAAGLVNFARETAPVYYIDPNPAPIYDLLNPLEVIEKSASEGLLILKKKLINLL